MVFPHFFEHAFSYAVATVRGRGRLPGLAGLGQLRIQVQQGANPRVAKARFHRTRCGYGSAWCGSTPCCKASLSGFLAAIGLFIATNWLVARGGAERRPGRFNLLRNYFPGYSVSFVGSFIRHLLGVSGWLRDRLLRGLALQPLS